MANVVPSLMSIAFVTKLVEKHNSASHIAVQMKNLQNTVNTKEKLDVRSQCKNVNELLICAVMIDSLIEVYIQFVIMEIEVFVWQDYHSPVRMNCTKTGCESYIFIALGIKKYTV